MSSMLDGMLRICFLLKVRVLNFWSLVRIFFLRLYIYFKQPRKTYNTLLNFKQSVWSDIREMPIYYWQEIVEKGDLLNLYKPNKKGFATVRLHYIWIDLQQQHMDEFGVDPMLRARIRAIKKIIQLNIKYVETRDNSILNLIAIEEAKLDQTMTGHSIRFYKLLDLVSTHKGFRIDPKQFTVVEWYHALNNMSNGESN